MLSMYMLIYGVQVDLVYGNSTVLLFISVKLQIVDQICIGQNAFFYVLYRI